MPNNTPLAPLKGGMLAREELANARSQQFESLERRVARLVHELELAVRWNRPAILLAVYASELIRQDAQALLVEKLYALGQRVEFYNVTGEENADIARHLSEWPTANATVFFVSGLQRGGELAYRSLNIRREYFVARCLRVVLWLTDKEAASLPLKAPDFWAFRSGVVQFEEAVEPERLAAAVREWREDATPFAETEAKIAFREALLKDLPEEESTTATRADLYYALGVLHLSLNNHEQAIAYLERALHLAASLDDAKLQLDCLLNLGKSHHRVGKHDQALGHYNRALAFTRERDDRLGEANTLQAIGDVHQFKNDLVAALSAYEEALGLFRKVGSRLGEANTLKAIGDVHRFEDDLVAALSAYEEALGLFRKVGSRLGEANVRQSQGNMLEAQNRHAEAKAELEAAHAGHAAIGDQYSVAADLYYLSFPLESLGEHEAACSALENALRTCLALELYWTDMPMKRLLALKNITDEAQAQSYLQSLLTQAPGGTE